MLPVASQISIDTKFLLLWIDQESTHSFRLHCCLWGMYGPPHSIFILIMAFSQIALVINAAFLVAYLVRRKSKLGPISFKAYSHNLSQLEAQDKLDDAKANLERIKKDQKALAEMQVDFENLKPHMDDIFFKLGIFAEVYSFVSPF